MMNTIRSIIGVILESLIMVLALVVVIPMILLTLILIIVVFPLGILLLLVRGEEVSTKGLINITTSYTDKFSQKDKED